MERLIGIFDRVAFIALIAMLFIVVSSVLARIIFDLSGGGINFMIPGSIELASYALLIMVFSSLPRSVVSGLVSVDLIIGACSKRIRSTLERIWDFLLAVFGSVVGYLFFQTMLETLERGDRTQDLGIPLYLFYGALSICSLMFVLTSLWLVLKTRDIN